MSREILTQEEIDALLEGLGQGEEDGVDGIEDFADGIAAKMEELLEGELIRETLHSWEWSFVSASTVLQQEGVLWGEVELTGAAAPLAYYYVDHPSLQSVREESRSAAVENAAGLVDAVVRVFCQALSYWLTEHEGQAVTAEPGPARTGETADVLDVDESWFRVRLWLESGADARWVLNFILPQDAVGSSGVSAPFEKGLHAGEGAPARTEERTDRAQDRQDSALSSGPRIQRAEFGELGTGREAAALESRIEMLMDVPLEVSVELGRTVCHIREVLSLGTGSILEMQKQAGEPVEVLVNGKLVARGEVVVVDENFAVRITEIVSVRDRVEKLG